MLSLVYLDSWSCALHDFFFQAVSFLPQGHENKFTGSKMHSQVVCILFTSSLDLHVSLISSLLMDQQ